RAREVLESNDNHRARISIKRHGSVRRDHDGIFDVDRRIAPKERSWIDGKHHPHFDWIFVARLQEGRLMRVTKTTTLPDLPNLLRSRTQHDVRANPVDRL